MYAERGVVIMRENAVITGNTAPFAGGVCADVSWFTMSGASSISDNTADNSYGGVIMLGGSFTMNSGASITGNSATVDSGGVYIDEVGELILYGSITGNSARSGGGVRVHEGRLVMNAGSSISGNHATAGNGGGVLLDSIGEFVMDGGEISGNEALGTNAAGTDASVGYGGGSGHGGGVSVEDRGTFTMNHGTISGNTAENQGGGVYVNVDPADSGTFTKSGAGTAIIYGTDAADTSNRNLAHDGDSDYGSAVYDVGHMPDPHQDTTLGPSDSWN
jgi:hypothetical protein